MNINKRYSKLKVRCFKTPNASYTYRCAAYEKRANAQIAHLVFADTRANAKKPKELFFANARKKYKKYLCD